MTHDFATAYYLIAYGMTLFCAGIYLGIDKVGWGEVVWSVILGVFWPFTLISIATYPLWRRYYRGPKQ